MAQRTSAEKAKVFMSGRSQAVRIPAEFRFTSNEVYIRRDPQNGDVILSQSPGSLRDVLAALHALNIPDDFLSATERAQAQQSPQERDL
jgi:antitoxin VapB